MWSPSPWGIFFISLLVSFSIHISEVEGDMEITYDAAILRAAALDLHNMYRAAVDPAASNMNKLRWSHDLEKMAQLWADKCNFEHGQPSCNNTPYANIGQNIYLNSRKTINESMTDPVASWYNEVSDFTYNENTCAEGKVCGHYTQIVWANTEELGCGARICDNVENGGTITSGTIVVCNYGPPGNYVGQAPYQSGNGCDTCPTKFPGCENSTLCIDSSANYYMIQSPPMDPQSANGLKCESDDGPNGGGGGAGGDGGKNGGARIIHLSMLAFLTSTLAALILAN